ncbi:MAG: PilZ domain-containing protein [Desulfobulbus sp.]|nr:PilZ domain-containing protein [Desulfobulbus sp.]
MTTIGALAFSPEKRRHPRVIFTRSVKVYLRDQLHGRFKTRNLSLGGMYVEGASDLPVGEDLRLELYETGRKSSLILTILAKVCRNDAGGVGVHFTHMEDDSFMFLQTMVLYSSDDPIGVAEHFLEGFASKSTPAR